MDVTKLPSEDLPKPVHRRGLGAQVVTVITRTLLGIVIGAIVGYYGPIQINFPPFDPVLSGVVGGILGFILGCMTNASLKQDYQQYGIYLEKDDDNIAGKR